MYSIQLLSNRIKIGIYNLYLYICNFRDLYNSEETRQVALDTFKKNKSSYMNVAIERVQNILEIVEKNEIDE